MTDKRRVSFGRRRSRRGKTTLLQMFADELLQKGVTQEQIQFYNFEDPDIYTIGNWKDIYDYVKVRLVPDKMNYIFLDEVQNIAVFQVKILRSFICDLHIFFRYLRVFFPKVFLL